MVVFERDVVDGRVEAPQDLAEGAVEGVDGTVAFAGGELGLAADGDLDGRDGGRRARRVALLHDDVEPQQLEKRDVLFQCLADEQLEGGVGGFELVAVGFEPLEAVEDVADLARILAQGEAHLAGLDGDVAAAGELADEDAAAVADGGRRYVLERGGILRDGVRVHAGLVREGAVAHERPPRVGTPVRHLVHEPREVAQVLELRGAGEIVSHLER